ncbi:MAG: rod shape-determining protein RodA [Azoarcus sp.]|jgi:rod shape determining protein RodA|nr:rod shape-determining protein RodA [Azoarcus sp.]
MVSHKSHFRFTKLAAIILRPLDPILSLLLACLLAYAIIIMMSASPARVFPSLDYPPNSIISAQLVQILLALGLMWIVANIPAQRLLSLAPTLYIAGVTLLVLVLQFGVVAKGAQRWLEVGGARFQPSELMKIAMPLALAWFFQKREGAIGWKEFLLSAFLLGVPVALIAKQPDLGTALLVAAAGIYVIFFAGLSWKLIVPVAVIGVVGIVVFAIFGDQSCQPGVQWPFLKEYQRDRVCTLLDPTRDPLGKGFHIIQSTIAIGSGGLTGRGWMLGTQTHGGFLPERHTDFIFAVLAEELGLAGVLVLLALYLAILMRGLFITAAAPSLGAKLLAGSMTMILFTYLFVNIGMVSGILPVVGVPLPFISYGGTALITLCVGIGILMSVRRSGREH